VIKGKPWVQKNNLFIYYRNPRAKTGAFVGHSKDLGIARDSMSNELYLRYREQGGRSPIDYPMDLFLVFYVERQHEPDLDNLPAIVCDAMQGIKVKGVKGARASAIIVEDKLVRTIQTRKIVKGHIDYVGEPRTEITVSRSFYGLK